MYSKVMSNTNFHCLSILLIMQCFTTSLAVLVRNLTTDQLALLEFKDHILDPHHVLRGSWMASSYFCKWVGVSCGVKHDRVVSLTLPNMSLTGTIPPHLGNLSFLLYLDLSSNNFYGNLPKELGQLHRLRAVQLSFNSLKGGIPSWLGKLHRVKKLEMGNNNFTGTIPQTLFNMSNLEILSLGYNQLSGQFPSSIFKISSLKEINVQGNSLSGSLPDGLCVYLPKLEELYLGKNELSGHIPSSIDKCRKLQILQLAGNRFNGFIPRNIGNLTQLKEIYLGRGNNLKGEIPEEIGKLFSLEIFSVAHIGLTGKIPASIFNISSMIGVALQNNSLSGNLPSVINVPKLIGILVWGNNLSGNIPSSISNASTLKSLELQNNYFSGLIPNTFGNLRHLENFRLRNNHFATESTNHEWRFLSSLANCKNLRILDVSQNPLNGILPTYIGNLSASVQIFDVSRCELEGNIPLEIGNCSNLLGLDLGNNKISGYVPATIGGLRNIQVLELETNELQGPIPENICGLERLYVLDLSFNQLYGPILKCLGNLTSLRYLKLGSNKLSFAIPSTLWSLKDILEIDLSSNYLSSSRPLDVGYLRALTHLNLSRNVLMSEISSTIGSLQTLVSLDLSGNKFHGHIPESFGGLISLVFLDLCNNNLSGAIPKSLEKLSNLNYFNVSFNKLEGEIPTGGRFQNFSSRSFMKNYALCGPPRLLVPPCKSSIHRNSRMTMLHVLRYVLPAIASIMIVVVLIFVLKRCQHLSKNLPVEEELLFPETWRRTSRAELIQATDGFGEHNMLGSGSFGSVYKGRLLDGTDVAIKVFNLQLEGAFRSFDIECEMLSKIVHRNVVKIITCCSNVDFKALVLDFMPNGSLEKWLRSRDSFLDIIQRVDIMIDVASALEYLHVGHPEPIYLKPSNILLDEDMVAHVGDFGMAKLLGEGDLMVQTMTLATIGYMAPEFGSAGIVSIKCDVYSYGILLIETFTKRKPTDEIFNEAITIRHWVKSSLSKGVMVDIADGDFLRRDDEYFVVKANCISSIMELALDCSCELPEERKDMKDAVAALKKIKQKLLNTIKLV
ncbi:hypothetical protein DITRI_Ditri01bG0136500 [Diplodiscus trichospermus]